MADNSTSYGFQNIDRGEKQGLVNDVFARVAKDYDIMNDLMSAGMHRLWKNELITRLRPRKSGPLNHLDVAGGTGDITFRLLDRASPDAKATILDISPEMLEAGKDRANNSKHAQKIQFVEGNAENLPFKDNTFDSYTIAFGIRNVPKIDKALEEAYRVLKPGGHFLCLEFSHVTIPMLDSLYEYFSFNIIPKIGESVIGDAEPYQYLVESIRKFPDQETFKSMIEDARFGQASIQNLSGGIAAIHSAWRI